MFDWIDTYLEETAMLPSPKIYRLWSAITAISGVLERKVHTAGAAGPIYPHLLTLLVGPPASGKTNAIRPIRNMWSRMQGLNISPDNVTKAALIDVLSRSLRTIVNGTSAYNFSALVVACSEFGVFFPSYDLEFLSVLNDIYDSPDMHREERRTTGAIEITKPHIVMLAGTQPDFLNSLLPEAAWGMGFTSRLIMIYATKPPASDLFAQVEMKSTTLMPKLAEIFTLRGEFRWTKSAVEEINAWNRASCPPTPTHNRLLHYIERRAVHTIKLSMISAASRCSSDLIVTVDDFERARDWLLAAEQTMPDIFRAMGQKSDAQIIADLHFHLYRLWSSVALDKRKPITSQQIYEFLHTRVPSERISKLIEVAAYTGHIRKGRYPDEWIPNALGTFGNA